MKRKPPETSRQRLLGQYKFNILHSTWLALTERGDDYPLPEYGSYKEWGEFTKALAESMERGEFVRTDSVNSFEVGEYCRINGLKFDSGAMLAGEDLWYDVWIRIGDEEANVQVPYHRRADWVGSGDPAAV